MTTAVVVMSGAAASSAATATRPLLMARNKSFSTPSSSSCTLSPRSWSCSFSRCATKGGRRGLVICCEVVLKSDQSSIDSGSDSDLDLDSDEELKSNLAKVGSKVRVKAPLKVHHVPKLPDLELTPDMVGVIKQYVGLWKGKRISPNYPFKVEFVVDAPDTPRGSVKFVAHLKEDEFQITS